MIAYDRFQKGQSPESYIKLGGMDKNSGLTKTITGIMIS